MLGDVGVYGMQDTKGRQKYLPFDGMGGAWATYPNVGRGGGGKCSCRAIFENLLFAAMRGPNGSSRSRFLRGTTRSRVQPWNPQASSRVDRALELACCSSPGNNAETHCRVALGYLLCADLVAVALALSLPPFSRVDTLSSLFCRSRWSIATFGALKRCASPSRR